MRKVFIPSQSFFPVITKWSTCLTIILFDWACCAALALTAAALHSTPSYKADHRIIPVLLGPSKQFVFPTELLYPYQEPIVSSPVCGFLVSVVPSIVILSFQLSTRSLPDFHAGTTGLVKAILAATIVSESLKHFVGGFRPHYIEVCQPELTLLTNINISPNTTWWMGPAACKGNQDDISQALWGFPSGHSATSFSSAMFLALYLNGKLKPFSDLAPGMLDLATVMAPLLMASGNCSLSLSLFCITFGFARVGGSEVASLPERADPRSLHNEANVTGVISGSQFITHVREMCHIKRMSTDKKQQHHAHVTRPSLCPSSSLPFYFAMSGIPDEVSSLSRRSGSTEHRLTSLKQVIAGALIGVTSGVGADKLRYAVLFDFRVSHIPRTTFYVAPQRRDLYGQSSSSEIS